MHKCTYTNIRLQSAYWCRKKGSGGSSISVSAIIPTIHQNGSQWLPSGKLTCWLEYASWKLLISKRVSRKKDDFPASQVSVPGGIPPCHHNKTPRVSLACRAAARNCNWYPAGAWWAWVNEGNGSDGTHAWSTQPTKPWFIRLVGWFITHLSYGNWLRWYGGSESPAALELLGCSQLMGIDPRWASNHLWVGL